MQTDIYEYRTALDKSVLIGYVYLDVNGHAVASTPEVQEIMDNLVVAYGKRRYLPIDGGEYLRHIPYELRGYSYGAHFRPEGTPPLDGPDIAQ
jgi:hypothetical protein